MNRVVAGIWLGLFSTLAFAEHRGPVAQWLFNETSGQIAHDSVSGADDEIGGLFQHVAGTSGTGLRFDGETTVITRNYKGAPPISSAVAVDAWVAVNTYPWNWVPIAENRR